MKQLWHDYMVENTKQREKTSDDWVKTMTESKENKEKYNEYLKKTRNPISYRKWLREQIDE